MKCNMCGQHLPNNSEFCQYCGAKIDRAVFYDTKSENITSEPNIHMSEKEAHIESSFTTNRSKYIILVLVVIMVILSLLNIYQFEQVRIIDEVMRSGEQKLTDIENKLADTEKELEYYKDEYAEAILVKNENMIKADAYDKIFDVLTSSRAGYSSGKFYASNELVVLRKDEEYESIKITCRYYDVILDLQCSGYGIDAEWDENWNGYSIGVKIFPKEEGVYTINFTNSYNSEYFDVLVIVI